MASAAGLVLALALVAFSSVNAKIPSYIHVCKRNDPNLSACIINSIENLRPHLVKGIPELDVPPLEPLNLPEIVVSKEPFRAIGTDVHVYGASAFIIKSLEANLDKIEYKVQLEIPKLQFDAIYDVDAKLLSVNLKGKGPIQANTSDVEGTGILKGHKETKDGINYVKFDSLELKLKMKNYTVKLENLFNGDKGLGEAVNVALNQNKRELMQLLKPRAEKTVSEVLLSIANKITQHFDFDELFPMS